MYVLAIEDNCGNYSGIVKRIFERPDRPDVKSTHIEGRDTRNRSRIKLNISRE